MTLNIENCTEKTNKKTKNLNLKRPQNFDYDFRQEIIEHMRQNNFHIDEEIKLDTGGKHIRFSIDEKQREKDEWYISLSGISQKSYSYCILTYGSWSTKEKYTYKSWESKNRESINKPSTVEILDIEKKLDEIIKKTEEEEKKRHDDASQKANEIWEKSKEEHTYPDYEYYLEKKGVKNFGVRYGDYLDKPALIIPLRNKDGKIRSLQFIYKDEENKIQKRFLSGGEKKGNFFLIGEIKKNKSLFICEGYATAASVYEATKKPTVVAFDAGNLKHVISNLRSLYPNTELIIAADKDVSQMGQKYAEEAASKYNCKVILPNFKDKAIDEKNTDFNDLQQAFDLDEVKRQLIDEPDYFFKEENEEVIIEGIPKKITTMQSLDKRFAQLEAPGQPCVLINRIDSQPISQSDFKSRLSGEVVVIGVDGNNNPKYVSASKFWIGNSRKRFYNKIVFTNKPVDDSTYNLFSGFGIKPKKGNCELILSHIKEVICSNNETNYDAFLKLLAWQIQNIGKPSRVITALKSTAQQVGKGCLLSDILAVIYGNTGFVTSEIGQIITRFNDTIRGKAYIFLDEALFSGDRKAADSIKSLATCSRMGVETKGIPTVQFPIAVNIFLATNHDDAAYIEETDARYWILEVSPHKFGNSDYFKNLYEEIENGGRAAFMDHLLSIDVSNFIPSRDVPKDNAAKEAMIRNSINPYDARNWLYQCCEAGALLGCKNDQDSIVPWMPWKSGVTYDNSVFLISYTEWQKTVKSANKPLPTAANNFGKLLNNLGFKQTNEGGKRWRTLPSIDELLASLQKIGKKP